MGPSAPGSSRARSVAVALIAGTFSVIAAATAAAEEERWYVVSIAGEPVGWYREALAPADGGGAALTSELAIVLNRLESRVEMNAETTTREAAGGGLLAVDHEMRASAQTVTLRAVAQGGVLRIESSAGGKTYTREMPVEGELLGPLAAGRRSAEHLRAPGDELGYRVFSPELGSVTGVTRLVVGVGSLAVAGEAVPVVEVTERLDAVPVESRLWLDRAGRVVQVTQVGPFGEMKIALADEASARLAAAAGGALPEESYAATLVRTGVRIPRPREVERLELELLHRRPELGWPELARPGQQVLDRSPERLVLALSRAEPPGELPYPVPAGGAADPYLEANAFLQSDDPALRALAGEIVAGQDDLFGAAKALERWVAENLTFDLGVVLAPSSEVLVNRRGTCTEYAVLLAALARAAGIPARFVMGYVYVSGIFGGHAWIEVQAGDRWLPLDAAVPAAGPADAARIAILDSSLAEGAGVLGMGPALQLYGQIDVRLRSIEVKGMPVLEVAPGAEPYSAAGEVYRNPWLGVELARPKGTRFVELDRVWPESTVVGIEGAGGERALLSVRGRPYWQDPSAAAREALAAAVGPEGVAGRLAVSGRAAATLEAPGRAGLALPVDSEVWLFTVEADGAPARLRALAGGLRLPGAPAAAAAPAGGGEP